MIEITFDIEDLSLLLKTRAKERPALRAGLEEDSPEDMSLSVIVDPSLFEEPDPTIQVHDTLTNQTQEVYRCDEGYLLRYRVAVLGIGTVVDEVHVALREQMQEDVDLEVGGLELKARFQTALFGGRPKGSTVERADASVLVDRLIHYRPNYLVLVNAGQVRERFADKSARQLAMITHHINQGAMYGGQRPYTLAMVTDAPIPNRVFSQYWRLCQTMNTFPAAAQFRPDQVSDLKEHSLGELKTYTDMYFQVKRAE